MTERSEVHIAIVDFPTIRKIMDGVKTIESRFSKNRVKPFGKVEAEDMVLLKKSGGDIYGYFFVESVESLTGFDVAEVERKYNPQIQADAAFWVQKRQARFATFMRCKNPVMANSGVFFKRIGMDGWLFQPICDGRQIVCFSGQPCAGKTAYAKALAKALNARYVHLDAVVSQDAMETSGAANPLEFAMESAGAESADSSIVFDGVRREGTFKDIRSRYGEAKLIYVEASERERCKRYIQKTGTSIPLNGFKEIDGSPAEREAVRLKDAADYIIHSRTEENPDEAIRITNNIVAALLTGRRTTAR